MTFIQNDISCYNKKYSTHVLRNYHLSHCQYNKELQKSIFSNSVRTVAISTNVRVLSKLIKEKNHYFKFLFTSHFRKLLRGLYYKTFYGRNKKLLSDTLVTYRLYCLSIIFSTEVVSLSITNNSTCAGSNLTSKY